MRKRIIAVGLLIALLVTAPVLESKAIVWVVVKAAVKKVIKAMDLQIQRQQNKVIWLQNAQKTLENALSKLKLNEISDWTDRQRKLYKDYFDELHKVRSLITYYQRIRDIARKHALLVEEYKRAWSLLKQDKNFSPEEIGRMGRVYEGILAQTLMSIEELGTVITSLTTTMSDAKRLEIIANVDEFVDNTYKDLRQYTASNQIASIRRASSQQQADALRRLYGLGIERNE